MTLLRDEINTSDIDKINIEIEACQKMISFYEEYLRDIEYAYAQQRLDKLYSQVAEYLIAREVAVERSKTTI